MGEKKPSVGGLFGATIFILFVSTLGVCGYVCKGASEHKASTTSNNQPSTSYSPRTPTQTAREPELQFVLESIRTCDKDIAEAIGRQRKAQAAFEAECAAKPLLRTKTATIDEPICDNGKVDRKRAWVNLSIPLGATDDRDTNGHTAWYRVMFDREGNATKIIPSKRASAVACYMSLDRVVP